MSDLPPGWKTEPLRNNCLKTTLTDPTKRPDEPFMYVDVSCVSNESFRIVETKTLLGRDAPSRARKQIRAEDIIFATVRPTLRRVALVPTTLDGQVCSTGYCVVRPDRAKLEPAFVYYWLLTDEVAKRVQYLQKGATYPAISDSDLLGDCLPLPPISEQRAIVHALRVLQEARDARRVELDAERERKAALMEDLFTCGVRGEPCQQTDLGPLPRSWEVVTFGTVVELVQYGTSEKCDADETGIPVLRIPNVIGGKVDVHDLKHASLPKKVVEGLRLTKGDLLFVRTNGNREYAGRCAMYNDELPQALFASYLIRARVKMACVWPQFAQLYTMTRKGREYLSGKASNAADGKFNINTQTIKGVQMPLPSLDEQREIAAALTACDEKIAALEAESALLDELFRAMLDDLMTGRLSALPLAEIEENHEPTA